jgi:membrane protein DedA with SNARE-associated domain
MLLCFGAAWPFSIWKSYKSRSNEGKSIWFLLVIFIGYIAGSAHKLLYNFDIVFYLYVLNGAMVFADMLLYLRNSRRKENRVRTKN